MLDHFGYNAGILIQIAASPPERVRLERLLARASADAGAEGEARQLIAALGAVEV